MRSFYSLWLSLLLLALVWVGESQAQIAKEYAVELRAEVQEAPPRITLKWVAIPEATLYTVRRRLYGETTWGAENFVEPPAAEYTDTKAEAGKIYEYRVSALTNKSTYGFITAGIKVPARPSEGTLLLLVGATAANTAAAGLQMYIDDVVRLGWNVEMQVVSETASPQEIKAKILEVRQRLSADLRSLFLFGRVPIPYSGNIAPDEHKEDHEGAWPADVYYGELDGIWTDVSVNNTSAVRDKNKNVPGDGKFDQSVTPGRVELEVGRVDFRDMGWFFINAPSQAEREALLLNKYLEKNHKFRTNYLAHNSKAVVSDGLGVLAPNDVPAAIAWRAFPLLTTSVEPTTRWMDTLSMEAHLWGYGAGYGDYFVAQGVGTTEEYSKRDPMVIFTMLFGSRFGDWDSPDNLLRAPLGTSTGLASMWAGHPYWYVHQMGIGMTIGEATRQSQSASVSYISTVADATVHMALMGDPTLQNETLNVGMPTITVTDATFTWGADPTPYGFLVSRGPSRQGPFTPLTTQPTFAGSFTDPSPSASEPYYLIRPVVTVTNKSGSFERSTRGEIVDVRSGVYEASERAARMRLSGSTLSFDVDGNATLTIIDVLGRIVSERAITASGDFDITFLLSGAYIAQLRTAKGIETLRFNK